MKVYLLKHSYDYEIYEDINVTNIKLIGIYSSRQNAEEVKERYKRKKGFNRHPEKCFLINEYIVNEDHWMEGFVTWENTKRRVRYDIPKKMGKKPFKESGSKETLKDNEVYLLEHYYEYDTNVLDIKIDFIKVIGIYNSEEKAEKVKEQIKINPGFNRYPEDCFYIDRYRLNEDHWTEGFITWDSETDSWIE